VTPTPSGTTMSLSNQAVLDAVHLFPLYQLRKLRQRAAVVAKWRRRAQVVAKRQRRARRLPVLLRPQARAQLRVVRPGLRRRIMVSVEELGGQDQPLAGHIRARILARITHSVCEVILGFWKGEGAISGGFWGKLLTLFCELVGKGGVLKGCEDVGRCIYEGRRVHIVSYLS
jgi:hypothetical protein